MTAIAFYPGRTYPSVSVTGPTCPLNCDLCRGRYLRGMATPLPGETLLDLARRLSADGARGLLISGGSDLRGRLPVFGLLDQVSAIKRELGLYLSVHPGLVSREEAEALRLAGFDSVDYDLPPGERAAGIRGFPYSEFLRSLDALTEAGPARVVPHILLGLPRVRQEDELSAIEEASSRGYDELVLLVFIPTEGTPFEGMNPPSMSRILPVVREARRIFGGELSLGCMRPKVLKRTLDPAVVEEGLVDRIAVPRPELVERGSLETVAACCAVPRSEFSRFPRCFLP